MEEMNFDPVKAEKFQEGMLRSRERMQKELDEKAHEYQEMNDKVSNCHRAYIYPQLTSSKGPKPKSMLRIVSHMVEYEHIISMFSSI